MMNIDAIAVSPLPSLAQRLARVGRHLDSGHRGEKVWLALVENPGSPLERSLTFHIAEALAVRSRKRVLLVDMSEPDGLVAARFATSSDQLRPSLFECACDPGSLHRHQAPTVASDGRHYPAITTLLPFSTWRGGFGVRGSGDFDIHSILRDLARYYDYLLLVTSGMTPYTVVEEME